MSRPLGSTPTPASRDFPATTGRSASERRVGTPCLRFLPRPAPSRNQGARLQPIETGWRYRRSPSHVPCKSRRPAHAASAPGTAWPILGSPPGSSRERDKDPRFRCRLRFTALQQRRPDRPTPGRAILERLPGPHLTRSRRASPLTLTTTVFSQRSSGWFDACPRRPTPEGQQSPISRTAPLQKELPTLLLPPRS